MNSRERLLAVLAGKVPDSVPRCLYDVAIGTYNDTTIELFAKKTGSHPSEYFRHDVRGLRFPWRTMPEEWHRQVRDIQHPDDVQRVMAPWMPPRMDIKELRQKIDIFHDSGHPAFVGGSVSDFETAFHLRGREQFFLDLGYREGWLEPFLDTLTSATAVEGQMAAAAGVDIFGIGDDLGSQRSLLISPEMWRELFKPRVKRIVDSVKNTSKSTAFCLHTDGMVMELIPDFIEIGIDILNPIQPEVMDPAEVKRRFGKDLVFFGGVSVQKTMPMGSPADVEAEVRLRMETIGAGGGYIMSPSHLINADIPWENIVAFFAAADKYGKYRD